MKYDFVLWQFMSNVIVCLKLITLNFYVSMLGSNHMRKSIDYLAVKDAGEIIDFPKPKQAVMHTATEGLPSSTL
jgi:hypothetical protein